MKWSREKPAREADKSHSPPLDRALAERALTQYGVLTHRQLEEIGLSADAAGKRVAAGRLYRVHRGVYAIVPPALLPRNGRFMAAVLACGERAALSHRATALLYRLRLRGRTLIDVTAPGSRGRGHPAIRAHSAATLAPQDRTVVDGIPCTTLARTLLDLAGEATRREIERACDEAELRGLLDMAAIDEVLARANGRRGTTLLRSVLAEHRVGSTPTRNDLEEAFLRICRDAGVPPDGANVWIPYPDGGGAEADFLWRGHGLIAEVDGRDPHTTRRAFESDRRRDQRLTMLGWRVVRFTWRQVTYEPGGVAATLRALLQRHAA